MFCYYFVRFSLRFSTHETQIAFYTINEQRNEKSIKNKSYTTTNTTTTNYDSITTAVTADFIAKSSLKTELMRERWDEMSWFVFPFTKLTQKDTRNIHMQLIHFPSNCMQHGLHTYTHLPPSHTHTHTYIAHWVSIFVCVFNWNFDFVNWCLSNLLQARERKEGEKRGESRR